MKPTTLDRADLATWPNLITLIRLCCIPVFVWLLFARDNRAAAAWLLAALGSTDWVDGWVARRFDQVSEFGTMFDPTVDRLMFLVAIPAMVIDGSLLLWVAVATLAREVLVTGIALSLAFKGLGTMEVTWRGKTGAFLLMFAFPMFLGGESTLSYQDILGVLAWLFVVPGLAYSWFSLLFEYGPEARRRSRMGPGRDGSPTTPSGSV